VAVDDCGFQVARKSRNAKWSTSGAVDDCGLQVARRSTSEVAPAFRKLDSATDSGCAGPPRIAVALRRRSGRERPRRPGSSSSVQSSSGAADSIIVRANRRTSGSSAVDSPKQPLMPLVLAPPQVAPPMDCHPLQGLRQQSHPQEQQVLRELQLMDSAAEAGACNSSGSHTRREVAFFEKHEQAEHVHVGGQVVGLEDLPRMGPAGTLPALWPACSESGTDATKAQPIWDDDMLTGWGCEAEQGAHTAHVRHDLEERERELAAYVAQACTGISVPPRPRW